MTDERAFLTDIKHMALVVHSNPGSLSPSRLELLQYLKLTKAEITFHNDACRENEAREEWVSANSSIKRCTIETQGTYSKILRGKVTGDPLAERHSAHINKFATHTDSKCK